MTKAAEQKAFRNALKSGQFERAYYLHGEDEYLKGEAVRQLLTVAVDPTTQAFNLDQRRGNDLRAEALGTLLGTPPMMADRRVIVIRDVEGLANDARKALDRYLKNPSSDILLVLVAGNGTKLDKGLAAVATAVEYAPLDGPQIPRWVAQRVEQSSGQITEAAISLLQDVAGNDLTQLALEIEKLCSYAGVQTITEAVVTAVVGVRREETLGHLLDAVGQRDAPAALAALPVVLQQPKSSAVTVVMALSVQTLALAWGRARGLPPARLSGEYFGLLKEAGSAYTGRSWGDAVSSWVRAIPRWTAAELDDALVALAQADEALKESRISSDEQLLSTLILTMCRTPVSRAAA